MKGIFIGTIFLAGISMFIAGVGCLIESDRCENLKAKMRAERREMDQELCDLKFEIRNMKSAQEDLNKLNGKMIEAIERLQKMMDQKAN